MAGAAAPLGVQCGTLSRLGVEVRGTTGRRPAFRRLKPRPTPVTRVAAAGAGHNGLPNPTQVVSPRRSGNYEPSSWTNFLRSLETSDRALGIEEPRARLPYLKKEISSLLKVARATPSTYLLELIDSIQQLGLGYHFKEEIDAALYQVTVNMPMLLSQNDLHTTALLFRLLRDNGYDVSQDIFGNFVNAEGSLTPCLSYGIKAILSLYEASFYGADGEDILKQANTLTRSYLKAYAKSHGQSLHNDKVIHALENPINWRMSRPHTHWYINMYANDEGMRPELLEFAKLDFSLVQHEYRKDLKEIHRWSSKLGLIDKMTYARDRLVEMFLFTIGMHFEPQFGYFRVEMAKVCILIIVFDDLYDVYGTIDELELFTHALERWDVTYAMEKLPHYMKICFMALFNSVNQLAYERLRDTGMEVAGFLKEMWVFHCKSYLEEARWYHMDYIPHLSEYMETAKITIGNDLLMAYAYVLLSQDMSPKATTSIIKSDLLHWSSIASRLVDDLQTSYNEKKRGDVAKALECYMHHEGVSEEDSRNHIQNMLKQAWENINTQRLKNSDIPVFLVEAIINHTRSMQTVYCNGDGVGFPSKTDKDLIVSLLVENFHG